MKDCMEAMREFPDKFFDLAVVDPPYGGGSQTVHVERERESTPAGLKAGARPDGIPGNGADSEESLTATISTSRIGGGWSRKYQIHIGGVFSKDIRHWDIAPPEEYFQELARVSKNQIIWGGNYFDLPPTRCFLVWRKLNIPLEGFSMAAVEYAWTSFNDNARLFECFSNGSSKKVRFHPTQKPVELYGWIYKHFAKPGDKILDTHLGSGSSRIAARDAGLPFWGYEIDETYFRLQEERWASYHAQESLFDMPEEPATEQESLF